MLFLQISHHIFKKHFKAKTNVNFVFLKLKNKLHKNYLKKRVNRNVGAGVAGQ